MGRIRILPYRQGSRGAKALAEALGGKVLKLENSSFTPREGDLIINWGNTDTARAHVYPASFIQLPNTIRNVSNKLYFFKKNEGKDWLPRFWTEKEDIPDDVYPVVCRTVLSGHSGAGILIANSPEEVVEAPLYAQYKKKKDEYRVHCGKGAILSVQRKARRLDCENPNWQVRNHANGFVYVRNDVNPPSCVTETALQAFEQSSLDFGAVDVIYNSSEDKAYVLEINTAPGLEGQTVEDYAEFFRSLM